MAGSWNAGSPVHPSPKNYFVGMSLSPCPHMLLQPYALSKLVRPGRICDNHAYSSITTFPFTRYSKKWCLLVRILSLNVRMKHIAEPVSEDWNLQEMTPDSDRPGLYTATAVQAPQPMVRQAGRLTEDRRAEGYRCLDKWAEDERVCRLLHSCLEGCRDGCVDE